MVRRQMHKGVYVQVRYPRAQRWVTVAVSETRDVATRPAADAYRSLRNPRGEMPSQVRIVSAAQLVREGGERAMGVADAELVSRARRHQP